MIEEHIVIRSIILASLILASPVEAKIPVQVKKSITHTKNIKMYTAMVKFSLEKGWKWDESYKVTPTLVINGNTFKPMFSYELTTLWKDGAPVRRQEVTIKTSVPSEGIPLWIVDATATLDFRLCKNKKCITWKNYRIVLAENGWDRLK
jgi:hypothetical protein